MRGRRALGAGLCILIAAAAVGAPSPGGRAAQAQEQGKTVEWLGLGDSYSAGEGLKPVDDEPCQRAKGGRTSASIAWAPKAARDFRDNQHIDIDQDFFACTGAITDNAFTYGKDQPDQVYKANEVHQKKSPGEHQWDVVSYSFGGNNVQFAKIIQECIGWSLDAAGQLIIGGWEAAPFVGCQIGEDAILDRIDAAVDASWKKVADGQPDCREVGNKATGPHWDPDVGVELGNTGRLTVSEMLDLIAACEVKAGGTVVVMGYPQLVDKSENWAWYEGTRCSRIRRADHGRLRSGVSRMNQRIEEAIKPARVKYPGLNFRFIDPNQFWEGEAYNGSKPSEANLNNGDKRHALCGKGQDWGNGLVPPVTDRYQRSFHPNQQGQDAMAKAVTTQLDPDSLLAKGGGGSPSTPSTPSTPSADLVSATALVVDTSGSMEDPSGASGQRKIDAAVAAGQVVTNLLTRQASAQINPVEHTAGLVEFNDFGTERVAATTDIAAVAAGLQSLTPLNRTNLGDGLEIGLDQVLTQPGTRSIVLLSDGVSNEGPSNDQVLEGVVARAVAEGVKIYTVGFGTAGDLDEPFLREIASRTGGEYSFADTPMTLVQSFMAAQASSIGSVQLSTLATVQQDETVPAGTFELEGGLGVLETSLAWPGSEMDIILRDPKGAIVDASYQGAEVVRDANPEVIVVNQPMKGEWKMEVQGIELPSAGEEFAAVASTRGTAPAPEPEPKPKSSGGPWGWIIGIVVALLAVVGLVLGIVFGTRSNGLRCDCCGAPATETTLACGRCGGPAAPLTLLVASGPDAGLELIVRSGEFIGRGMGADHQLSDGTVSQMHAQVLWIDGGWAIIDCESTSGTHRNGEPVLRAGVRPNDVVSLGATDLLVSVGPFAAVGA